MPDVLSDDQIAELTCEQLASEIDEQQDRFDRLSAQCSQDRLDCETYKRNFERAQADVKDYERQIEDAKAIKAASESHVNRGGTYVKNDVWWKADQKISEFTAALDKIKSDPNSDLNKADREWKRALEDLNRRADEVHQVRLLLDRLLEARKKCKPAPPVPPVVIGVLVALVGAVILGGWLLIRDDNSAKQPIGVNAIPVDDGEPAQLHTPGPTPPTTAPAKVSGLYRGGVKVKTDPAGHACCVKPATQWEVLQVRDTTSGKITVRLGGVVNGITIEAPLSGTGAPFTAVGHGTVAGYTNTEVKFAGTVTPEQGLHGTLTVGGNGTLPKGQAIVFTVDMAREG